MLLVAEFKMKRFFMLGWQAVLGNKRILGKWLVAVVLPVLLIGGYLGATSHSNQKTDRLVVAVINQDKAASLNGKNQRFGDTLQQQLKESKHFKTSTYQSTWAAKLALKQGRISAMIEIPTSLTTQLADYKKSGKSGTVNVTVATGNSQYATQYIEDQINAIVAIANNKLSLGNTSDSTLSKLSSQSQNLAKQTKDLQTNLQAVGNSIDADAANDLQSNAADLITDLSTYSAQLNDAVNAGDKTKIQSLAVEINNISYKMQTTIAGGIGSLATNLSSTKALSDQSGVIQSSAKNINSGQQEISSQLKSLLSNQPDKNTALTQMLMLKTTDIKPIKTQGQVLMASLLVVGVSMMSVLFGLLLPVKPTKTDALALEQWWENFQIGGLLSILGSILMVGSAFLWHVNIGNFWYLTGITLLSQWSMMSLVWYLKQWLGQSGWWLSTVLLAIQTVFVVPNDPILLQDSIFAFIRPFWPLSALKNAVNSLVFGGNDIEPNVMILIIWLLALTILLVTYYRVKQRKNLKQALNV